MKRPLLGLALLLTAGAAMAIDDGYPEGYTCCNLHYDGDWISDANWASMPMIPAGSRIKLLSWGSNRASVEIEGIRYRIGHDYGRNEQTLEQYLRKLVVQDDPRETVAAWPEPVREAIRLGKLTSGMTREQAIVAAGYPPTHQTRVLEGPVWRYWNHRFSSFTVSWKPDGTLGEVSGSR